MPFFQYRATNPQGKIVTGTLEMLSESLLKTHLKNQGFLVLKIEEKKNRGNRGKISIPQEHLALFTSQLAQLLKASLPLDQSLEALEEQSNNSEMKALTSSMKEKIRRGSSFSEVLGEYPAIFPPLFQACVEAGESIGSIGDAVARINTLLSTNLKLKQKLVSLLLYPILLFCLLITAICVLSFFVLPSLEGLFEGKALPPFTTFVFTVSHLLQRYWSLGLVLFSTGALGFFLYVRKREVQQKISKKLLRIPLIGHFILLSQLSRFSVTLSLLIQGGLPLVKALELAKESMTNITLKEEIQHIIESLIHGEKLSSMFKRSTLFPPLIGRFAYLGEETGKLGELFAHIGTMYEDESTRALERTVSLLQPLLLLIMGLIIGTTILSILLPLSDFGSMMSF